MIITLHTATTADAIAAEVLPHRVILASPTGMLLGRATTATSITACRWAPTSARSHL